MPTRAHLLLQVEPDHCDEAYRYVAALPSVTEAAVTSGPYDVIALLSGCDDGELSRAVGQVRRAPGLSDLRVCRGR